MKLELSREEVADLIRKNFNYLFSNKPGQEYLVEVEACERYSNNAGGLIITFVPKEDGEDDA